MAQMKVMFALLMLTAVAVGETKMSASFDKEHPGYLRVCWDDVCTVAEEVTWTVEDCRPTDNSVKPLVVPAIHVRDWTFNEETYYWDCEDKTRILEHDQQNPPKYWCRMEVQ